MFGHTHGGRNLNSGGGCRRGLGLISIVLLLSLPQSVDGRKVRTVHTVKTGESVASVADFYGVSQRDLRELNKLRKGKGLRIGQKLRIPNVLRVNGRKYRVKPGDSLALIAGRFGRSVERIAAANKLSRKAVLSVGQTLVIPDRENSSKTIALKGRRTKSILFIRLANGERARLRLYGNSGRILPGSVNRLSRLARERRGRQRVKRLHYRLIEMLQRVAWQFPDKPIRILSGYRPQSSGNETQHAFGRAVDFRMPGVPTRSIFQFCKTLSRSGCGYYPVKNFVHMDARERRFSWIRPEPQKKKPAVSEPAPTAPSPPTSPPAPTTPPPPTSPPAPTSPLPIPNTGT